MAEIAKALEEELTALRRVAEAASRAAHHVSDPKWQNPLFDALHELRIRATQPAPVEPCALQLAKDLVVMGAVIIPDGYDLEWLARFITSRVGILTIKPGAK